MIPVDVERVLALRAEGKKWEAIGREIGTSADRARRAVDPSWAEHRRDQVNANRNTLGYGGSAFVHLPDMTVAAKRRAEEMLQRVPRDTRDLTARLLGDPLPGRSAFDRRKQR